jgi:hypothetical protein
MADSPAAGGAPLLLERGVGEDGLDDVRAWGETGPLSQGVQAGRKALRTRHINGMEVRKRRPGGVKKRPGGFKRAP